MMLVVEPTQDAAPNTVSIGYQYKFGSSKPTERHAVIDSGTTFFEVLKTRPKFTGLYQRLEPYKGPSLEAQRQEQHHKEHHKGLITQDLLETVQASQQQLLEYLFQIHAVPIHGIII
jgi:hypothetical protein